MKLPRLAASAIGVAIVAASAFAIAAPANAATPGVTYVTAATINQAANDDGEPGWVEYSGRPLVSGTSGLEIEANSEFAYGLTPYLDATTGTAVVGIAAETFFSGASNGAAFYPEIAFFDQNGDASYLVANLPGADGFTDPTAQWRPYDTFGTFAANSLHTLADFDDELENNVALAGWTIISVGFGIDDDTNLYTASINGADFSFMPTPVSSAPTSLTQAAYAASGITITTTGFLPGENVEVYQSFPSAAGPSGGNAPGFTADANGAVTYKFLPEAGVTPLVGAYNLTFVGTSGVQLFEYTVVAALAATGTDSFAPLAAGGVLLLGGAALAIVAVRKRRTV